ncbi:hypothetical protein [Mesorhizobium sp. M0244]|uniref:hypothetical protein n=1 Tax=Mesorhizobium sp. M0244 TaxID=2956926 RepID=UPI003335AE9B
MSPFHNASEETIDINGRPEFLLEPVFVIVVLAKEGRTVKCAHLEKDTPSQSSICQVLAILPSLNWWMSMAIILNGGFLEGNPPV